MKTKYDYAKKLALDMRRANPEMSGPEILAALREMGTDPLPTPQTLSRWCRLTGNPIPPKYERPEYPVELRNRAVAMREAGLMPREIRARFAREMDNPPSTKWISQYYYMYGDKGARIDVSDPFAVVGRLKNENAIELSECWDELVNRGADEDKALDWVMDKFYGGNGDTYTSVKGVTLRKSDTDAPRVYSIREGRRVAA